MNNYKGIENKTKLKLIKQKEILELNMSSWILRTKCMKLIADQTKLKQND